MKEIEQHLKTLLNSYEHWLQEPWPLYQQKAQSLKDFFNQLDYPVLSHGTQEDPILNYGNKAALELWEMDWPEFIQTPSRLTAEAPLREERDRLLKEVSTNGFISDYSGIRVSKSGKRFFIPKAMVWNIIDEKGTKIGQAATFNHWTFL